MDLEEIRKKIDRIDSEIVANFEERMAIAREVAAYKKANKMAILDSKREEKVIQKNIDRLKNKDYSLYVKGLYEYLMTVSRDLQTDIVASAKDALDSKQLLPSDNYHGNYKKAFFQGVRGAYSEEALLKFLKVDSDFSKNCETDISYKAVTNFSDVIKMVRGDSEAIGILPIENSSGGAILQVERLLSSEDVYILGEYSLKIDHKLIGIGEVGDIKEVYSHSQAFLQCDKYLSNKNWNLKAFFNTAKSAKEISALQDKSKAAIASGNAAKIYGLKILKDNIQMTENNYTRFIIIGAKSKVNPDANKVSISFRLEHSRGTLFNIVRTVKENALNMLKIQSSPIVGKVFEYEFFLDFKGNISEPHVIKTLQEIRENSTDFKFLGNYKESEWQ